MIIVNISKSGATAATEAQIRDAACRAWVLSGQSTPDHPVPCGGALGPLTPFAPPVDADGTAFHVGDRHRNRSFTAPSSASAVHG
jgi:hypothetical protein